MDPAGPGAVNPALPVLAAFSQSQSGPLAIAYSGGADSTALLLAGGDTLVLSGLPEPLSLAEARLLKG